MTALDLLAPAPRGAVLSRLARLLAAVEWPRLRPPAPPPRLSPHLLRDLGLTPAEYDGL